MAGRNSKQRDISDFFGPFAKTRVPAKRASPAPDINPIPSKKHSPSPDVEGDCVIVETRSQKAPKKRDWSTPTTSSRFKNVDGTPLQSPIPFKSQAVLPVGSPRKKSTSQESSTTSRLSAFNATPPAPRTSSFDFPSVQPSKAPGSDSYVNAPSSSKKIIEKGKLIAVRDSDEDSDTSLEDIDDILGIKRHDTSSTSSSPPDLDGLLGGSKSTQRPRLLDRTPLLGRSMLNATKTRTPKHRFMLDDILAQHLGDQSTEETVTKTKINYEEQRSGRSPANTSDTDKNLLAALAFEEEEGEGSRGSTRLLNAIERTEAISGNGSWSFFDTGAPKVNLNTELEFPETSLGSPSLDSVLTDRPGRRRAFLSGYVAEKWSEDTQDPSRIAWLLNSILCETDQDLLNAYIFTIKHIAANATLPSLDPETITGFFVKLGARKVALQSEEIIRLNKRPNAVPGTCCRPLVSIVHCLASIARHFTQDSLQCFASILVRLMVDENFMKILSVSTVVEDALCTILDSCHAEVSRQLCEYIENDAVASFTETSLQKELLSHLNPFSLPLANLRLRLAQSFLLGASSTNRLSLQTLRSYLYSPRYESLLSHPPSDQHSYDFHTLSCHVAFLSVCLNSTLDLELRISDPLTFNDLVDNLADRIKSIFSTITDTGASHMQRTEVKESLEMLMFRLMYEIRTKPRPKKSLWAGDRPAAAAAAEARGKSIMKRFLFTKGKDSGGGQQLQQRKQKEEGEEDRQVHTAKNEDDKSTTSPHAEVSEEEHHVPPEGSFESVSTTEGAIRSQLGLDA